MVQRLSGTAVRFNSPESLGRLSAETAAEAIRAAADIALIIDRKGMVEDLAFGAQQSIPAEYRTWLGKPWVDTVADHSRGKVERLLRDANEGGAPVPREVNQVAEGAPELPVRYTAVSLGPSGRVLVVGHDLRATARLQQQIVNAQLSMEREYARLRHAETRYRVLFQLSREPVLIADAANERVIEANPALLRLVDRRAADLAGRPLSVLFDEPSQARVRTQLAAVGVAGWADDLSATLSNGRDVVVSSSGFRQSSGAMVLLRLAPTSAVADPVPPRTTSVLNVVASMPDAFAVVDADRRVLSANLAFVELVQFATEQQVLGFVLDRWLGRPGVDMNILLANLKEHGSVRAFSTVIRGEYGVQEEAEVSAVSAMNGAEVCYGFVIRATPRRAAPMAEPSAASGVDLTQLVGRVSLKEIIRDTTDAIERRCIETALNVSGDNRASAAQLLGLSRQSLYSKLRRYGLHGSDNEDDG